jgi:hypothetical protein
LNKKATGDGESDPEYNIEINVDSKDSSNDGVGASMSVASEVINIDGVVGSGAVLTGKSVTVSQSTHKTSVVKAKDANIKVSRGNVYAKSATIDILEMGTIYAEDVNINMVAGGKIICKSANIGQLKCDINIEAEARVDFGIIDFGKHFIIKAKRFVEKQHTESEEKNTQDVEKKLRELMSFTSKQIKDFKKLDLNIKSNINSINAIKARALEEKKSGEKPSESYIKAIRNFNSRVAMKEELASSIKENQAKAKEMNSKLQVVESDVKNLVVSTQSGWPPLQKIEYIKDDENVTLVINKDDPSVIKLSERF